MDYGQYSIYLSWILDCQGVNRRINEYRRVAWRQQDSISNRVRSDGTHQVIGGSKGEGLSKPHQSDIDTLYFYNDVVCIEEGMSVDAMPAHMTVMTTNPYYYHHGYTYVTLQRPSLLMPSIIHTALCPVTESTHVVSSDIFRENIKLKGIISVNDFQYHGSAGPALAVTYGRIDYDCVFTLESHNPTIMNKWVARSRLYDWPPTHLLEKAKRMRGNLVATGHKQSDMKPYEWRQCFNEFEIMLVENFTDTHTHLLALLKMVLKEILRPKAKELTSFIMKNIVFWMAEQNPTAAFRRDTLISWLTKALIMLRHSVEINTLPYYMIPERNLFQEKMSPYLRERMLKRLDYVLTAGPCVLVNCKKIREAMSMEPEELSKVRERKDELEMLELTLMNHEILLHFVYGMTFEQAMNDETWNAIFRRQAEIVMEKWPEAIEEELHPTDLVKRKVELLK